MGNGTYENTLALRGIERHLERIANFLEAQELRARKMEAFTHPDSLGALALWRWEVGRGETTVGFADWLAWHESDKAEQAVRDAPSAADVEAAAQAVKRGFGDMEAQVKGEGD